MAQCNSLSIDVAGLQLAIQDAAQDLVYDVADKIVTAFGHYAYYDGAGRHVWRANAAKEFKVISENIADELIEVELGLNQGLVSGSPYASQIMVALFGNHPPIYSKPGSQVWNDDMTGFTESTAMHVYGIPQFGWEDPGAESWLQNCFKITSTYFKDGFNAILSKINFYDYVYVTAGG